MVTQTIKSSAETLRPSALLYLCVFAFSGLVHCVWKTFLFAELFLKVMWILSLRFVLLLILAKTWKLRLILVLMHVQQPMWVWHSGTENSSPAHPPTHTPTYTYTAPTQLWSTVYDQLFRNWVARLPLVFLKTAVELNPACHQWPLPISYGMGPLKAQSWWNEVPLLSEAYFSRLCFKEKTKQCFNASTSSTGWHGWHGGRGRVVTASGWGVW